VFLGSLKYSSNAITTITRAKGDEGFHCNATQAVFEDHDAYTGHGGKDEKAPFFLLNS